MGKYRIGQPVRREEDPRLLKGMGRFVDDVRIANEARGYVLRSPHAHADIVSLETARAKAAPGVLAVLNGEDVAARGLGTLRPMVPRKRRDGSPAFVTPQPLLAQGRVRYAGEAVAYIIADTLNQAKDAADLIDVVYQPLPAVVTADAAMALDGPAIWADNPGNEAFFHEVGDNEATEAAFAKAAHIVTDRIVINRVTANSMEPRGCLAEYDPIDERYTIRCTIQSSHGIRGTIANQIFKLPHNKVRVICDNMGGGFGMKGGCYPEYALSMWAAEVTGRAVKWIAERSEGILTDEQARDSVVETELALDKDGKFLALRTLSAAAIGAYNTSDRNINPTLVAIGCLANTYTLPAIHGRVMGVLTNTMMIAFYRGGGRPEPLYVIETIVDKAARELELDPAELRRRNTVPADAMPFTTALRQTYDCGDFLKNLEDCKAKADYDGIEKRRAEVRKRGQFLGIGVSNTVSAAAGRGFEHAEIRFDPSGAVTLLTGSMDHGQGHATTYKQILSEKLSIDADLIRYSYGDTDVVTMGMGTFGSRSTALAGSAIVMASEKIIEKGKRIAAHFLETAVDDIAFEDGKFTVVGTDRSMDISEIAKKSFQQEQLPSDIEAGFYGRADFGSDDSATYPNGTHIVEVELDAETGRVALTRYSAVDDVGTMINPLLCEGQVFGGIAQGAGQALMEDLVYDRESGQLLSGSFTDYCMPRADDFCEFELSNNVVPTKKNVLGAKGAGEAGTVGALPAVMNAVNDALFHIGAPKIDMPAKSEKVWRAIQAAGG